MRLLLEKYGVTLPPAELLFIGLILALAAFFFQTFFLRSKLNRTRAHNKQLQKDNFELQLTLDHQQHFAEEKERFLEYARAEMAGQFSSLAQEIIDKQAGKHTAEHHDKLNQILRPLQERLGDFKDDISKMHIIDNRDRASLRQEIHALRSLNQQISEEATNLTRALKGDKKVQGTWGEIVLEKILELSGLRKDHEYQTQKGYRDKQKNLFKPDAVLHLPGQRDIIVDSKVSLVAWEKHITTEDPEEKQLHLKSHVQAIKQHIKSLAAKDYSSLEGLNSPEYILLFMPIDSACSAAMYADQAIFEEAASSDIIVVSPSSFYAVVRTIESFWKQEKQNSNAVLIADKASNLYDKFRGFVEDMEKLGVQLDNCTTSYTNALNKLTTGKGNLVSQSQQLTELGIRVKKELPDAITKKSDTESLPN